ncbi:hypothetical protein BDZ89DRAFT_1142992 [Hymenopellis radicata]|nr:hypothetical protein BDZ89DRAFT_1142992 [Hymenopellis radicata]
MSISNQSYLMGPTNGNPPQDGRPTYVRETWYTDPTADQRRVTFALETQEIIPREPLSIADLLEAPHRVGFVPSMWEAHDPQPTDDYDHERASVPEAEPFAGHGSTPHTDLRDAATKEREDRFYDERRLQSSAPECTRTSYGQDVAVQVYAPHITAGDNPSSLRPAQAARSLIPVHVDLRWPLTEPSTIEIIANDNIHVQFPDGTEDVLWDGEGVITLQMAVRAVKRWYSRSGNSGRFGWSLTGFSVVDGVLITNIA